MQSVNNYVQVLISQINQGAGIDHIFLLPIFSGAIVSSILLPVCMTHFATTSRFCLSVA